MKKLSFGIAVMALALGLVGCKFSIVPPGNQNEDPVAEDSLAVQLVNEWASSLESATVKSLSPKGGSRAIVANSQIDLLKAAALQEIVAAGKADSTKMDEILPPLVKGLRNSIGKGGYAQTEIVQVMTATANALADSATKTGREAMVSGGVKITDVVGIVASEVTKVIINEVNSSASLANAAVSSIVDTVITALKDNVTLDTVAEKKAAIDAVVCTVSASICAAADDGNTAVKGNIAAFVSSVSSGAASSVADVLSVSDASSAMVSVISGTMASAGSTISLSDKQAIAEAIVVSVCQNLDAPQVNASAMAAAITSGNTEVTTDNVASIVAEGQPTAAANATPTSLTHTGTINLSATGSAAGSGVAGVEYSWALDSGPSTVVITGDKSAAATASIDFPGTYTFKLSAKNSPGYKSAFATVTVIANFAADDKAKGFRALACKDWSSAKAYFKSAYNQNSDDTEAAMWYSVLDLASIGTNADVVDLMKNRIGFVGYPSDLGTLLSKKWFDAAYYARTNSDGTYDLATVEYMPTLIVPSWLEQYVPTPDHLNPMYYSTLLCSIVDRNPTGFNAAIDKVLSGVYGSIFEAAYARIMGLADDAEIKVSSDVMTAIAGNGLASGSSFTLAGRELKVFAEQMRIQKALVEYIASYQLQYPIKNAMQLFIEGLHTAEGVVDYAGMDNPIEAGFLKDRDSTMRSKSKNDLETALDDFRTTAAAFTEAACGKYVDSTSALTAQQIAAFFVLGKNYAVQIEQALVMKTAVDFPGGMQDLYLGPLFDTAFFSLDNLVETHGSYGAINAGLVFYGASDVVTPNSSGPNTFASHAPDMASVGPWDCTKYTWAFIKISAEKLDSVSPLLLGMIGGSYTDAAGNTYWAIPNNEDPISPTAWVPSGKDSSIIDMMSK